jgi:hypothetical protein
LQAIETLVAIAARNVFAVDCVAAGHVLAPLLMNALAYVLTIPYVDILSSVTREKINVDNGKSYQDGPRRALCV